MSPQLCSLQGLPSSGVMRELWGKAGEMRKVGRGEGRDMVWEGGRWEEQNLAPPDPEPLYRASWHNMKVLVQHQPGNEYVVVTMTI